MPICTGSPYRPWFNTCKARKRAAREHLLATRAASPTWRLALIGHHTPHARTTTGSLGQTPYHQAVNTDAQNTAHHELLQNLHGAGNTNLLATHARMPHMARCATGRTDDNNKTARQSTTGKCLFEHNGAIARALRPHTADPHMHAATHQRQHTARRTFKLLRHGQHTPQLPHAQQHTAHEHGENIRT